MKTFYFKLDPDGIIQDAIEYPAEGYTAVQVEDMKLPSGINGGWYRWTGAAYEIVESKKPVDSNIIKTSVMSLSDTVLFLLTKIDALTEEV